MTDQTETDSLRKLYAAAIRPTMLMGLQDAELDGPGGTQRINEWVDWITKELAAVRDQEMEQLRARVADLEKVARGYCPHCDRGVFDPTVEDWDRERKRAEQAEAAITTFTNIFEGFGRLLATSSRDWQPYRVDAWLWAVVCGWDCEEAEHTDTCTHGAMEETAALHGWDDATVAKARRYRAAVRTALDQLQQPTSTGK